MMNFNWANELAKNALKTAQKRIDSVLDIAPGDEAENDEDASGIIISSENETLEHGKQSEHHENWEEANSSFTSAYDGTSGVEVVDSEPNPIRDSHHAGLLPHSPCSNSPEEELVCSGEEHGEEQDALRLNDTEKHKDSHLLEPTVYEDTKHFVTGNSSYRNDKHHDDTLTLISSDFEVLRQSDSCSMASSVPPKTLSVSSPDATVETCQQAKEESDNNLTGKQQTHAETAHLRTQIQYQERRIRDLQFQNQRLEAKSKELLALKAMRTQQSTTEAKLLKKLNEKETKLADLLHEGEKLAEMNGKLTKELKRLRASLAEHEQLAKKSSEAETDRDRARDEARTLATEVTKLRTMIKSLESNLAELKVTNEGLTSDLKRKDDKINKLLADVQQSEASRELAHEELKRLGAAFEEASIKVKQKEMSSKSIEEITRGLNADLEEEKKKNEQQSTYIDSLEKRLGEMMEANQNNAEMIANVSAPLLESIQHLEEKVSAKDKEYEQTICEKEVIINALNSEKGHIVIENEETKKENEKLRERIQGNLVTIEKLNEHVRQVEQQNSILEINSRKLLHKIEELTKKLSEKEDEIGMFYVRLNNETDAFKKCIIQKQSELDDAKKYSDLLEKELHKWKKQSDEYLLEREKRQDHCPSNGGPFMLTIPNHTIQVELADALAKYEQSMRQISILEEKISTMEAESQCLGSLRHELQTLRSRYENLLEAHGEKIERVEELELDLADLKKLLKDQMEYFLEKS